MKKTIPLTIEQYEDLFEIVLGPYELLHRELHAHQTALGMFRIASAESPKLKMSAPELDAAVMLARKSERHQAKLRSAYNVLREKFHRLALEARTPKDILKAFDMLKKTKQPN